MSSTTRIGIAVFGVIGLALLVVSAVFAHSSWQQSEVLAAHAAWPHVNGSLVSVNADRDAKGEWFYRTETAWTLPDGRRFTHSGLSNHLVAVGDPVPLRYDPANPATAESPDAAADWMAAAVLAAMGGAFLGISVKELAKAWGQRGAGPEGSPTA